MRTMILAAVTFILIAAPARAVERSDVLNGLAAMIAYEKICASFTPPLGDRRIKKGLILSGIVGIDISDEDDKADLKSSAEAMIALASLEGEAKWCKRMWTKALKGL